MLLNSKHSWVAWWVDDPANNRLEIDVCLHPDREGDEWSYVDLELDLIRHEDGSVEIVDRDEFNIACQNRWITPEDAELAEFTAVTMEAALRRHDAPFGNEGWVRLDAVRRHPRRKSNRTAITSQPMDSTTINGQPVQIVARFIASDDGVNCIEAITIRGDRNRDTWPIGTDVAVSFPEEAIRGCVVAVVPKRKDTEVRVLYRSKNSSLIG